MNIPDYLEKDKTNNKVCQYIWKLFQELYM